ncbi:MAG: SRPBCC domain-containing protein [Opitutales bacterium]
MTAPKTSPVEYTSDRDFTISRVFDAPPELVWQAWTEPRHLSRWWGPREFTNPVCELELKPGGAYRLVMRAPDGTEYPLRGVMLEIDPPRRLVMTMDCSGHPESWHDLVNPRRKPGTDAAGPMVQTVTMEDLGGQTRLTVHTRFESAAIRNGMVKIGMTEGWSQSLDRLAGCLAALR